MKLKRLFPITLALFMMFSALASANSSQSSPEKESVKIDFSLEGRNVNVLSLEDGKLESYDENGVKTTTYLKPKELAVKAAEVQGASSSGDVGIFSYDTNIINMHVPRNITGNEGALVGGGYFPVSPHNYVNLAVLSLPQTTMPTINVAFTNASGTDTAWRANVPQNSLVYMPVSYPGQSYAARVSTGELYSAIATLRSYTD